MPKNPISTRISSNDLSLAREYQQWRRLPTRTLAISQMIRFTHLCIKYATAQDTDRKTGNWYKPPKDYTYRTPIDEMDIEQRDLFMRGFLQNYIDKLGFNDNNSSECSNNNDKDGTSYDDIFGGKE